MLFNENNKLFSTTLVFIMFIILTVSSVAAESINTSISFSINIPPAGTECKYSAAGQTCGNLGAHCGFTGDSSHPADPPCCPGMDCFYAMCMARIGTSCTNTDQCNGPCENSVIDCQGGKCCGRHAHPCNGGRDSSDCCEGFHCDQAGTEGRWPYYNFCEGDEEGGEESCTGPGRMMCDDSQCNIGHAECNPEPPAKTYTVPAGQRCRFTGTIRNSGCTWKNPATLSVSGPGCSQQIHFSDCNTKSFNFTCNPGTVTLSADDSAYFTLIYSCSVSAPCGNGIIEPGEVCELPFTNNNAFCSQQDQECLNHKLGLRDGFGYCNSACSCFEDEFVYQCVAGQCGASCSVNSDCNDDNPGTPDICLSNCSCSHSAIPSCGNGLIDPGEECESNTQCPSGESCINCQCTGSSYCGNNIVNSGEQCDNGAFNGIPCVPPAGGQCSYCSASCTWATIIGGSCGNGIVDYGEQCDSGSNNGVACTPSCDDSCAYCGTNCQVTYANGESCSGNEDDDDYYDGYGYDYDYYNQYMNLPCSYYGVACNRPRASICGDGITGLGEECDDGRNNGAVCIPDCGKSCTYCTRNCKAITLQGGACVYTPRPWDVELPVCREIFVPVNYSHLDYGCGAENDDVTKEVLLSDNLRAEQKACNLEPSYIDLHWFGLGLLRGFRNISIALEHKESYANIKLEYYDGSTWNKLCDLYSSTFDSIDECLLPDPLPTVAADNLSIRIRISRTGNMESVELLDFAALKLVYCMDSAYACGNGRPDLNEECDDGNVVDGDGCSSICTIETWSCGAWSACSNSKQTQLCTYGSDFKTNTRTCKPSLSWLWILFLIILIFLLLILLFLPYLFLAFAGKKKKRKK